MSKPDDTPAGDDGGYDPSEHGWLSAEKVVRIDENGVHVWHSSEDYRRDREYQP